MTHKVQALKWSQIIAIALVLIVIVVFVFLGLQYLLELLMVE